MAGLGTSALPFSLAGLGASGSTGACLAGQACWNGRRFCFPNRFGAHRFGNGYASLGGDYWGSDYDTTPRKHLEAVNQNEPEPPALPATVPAAATPPSAANTPPAVVSHEFAYGTIVTEVQNRLAGAGFFRGSIDGYLTAGTRTAIAMYQDSRQLVITGRIDAALLQALGVKP